MSVSQSEHPKSRDNTPDSLYSLPNLESFPPYLRPVTPRPPILRHIVGRLLRNLLGMRRAFLGVRRARLRFVDLGQQFGLESVQIGQGNSTCVGGRGAPLLERLIFAAEPSLLGGLTISALVITIAKLLPQMYRSHNVSNDPEDRSRFQ